MKRTQDEEAEDSRKKLKEEQTEETEIQEEKESSGMKFKLKIGNLGRNCAKQTVKKLLNSLGLEFHSIKAVPKWTHSIVSFEKKDHLNQAIAKLDGYQHKQSQLHTTVITQQERIQQPKEFVDDGRTPHERIADQVTPQWRIPYPEQLSMKNEATKKQFTLLKREMLKYFPRKNYNQKMPDYQGNPIKWIKDMTPEQRALEELHWIHDALVVNDGLICPLADTTPSPKTEEYRTKCEFTFGRDLQGEKSVGFLLGLFKNGITTVLNPSECLNVSKDGKTIANLLEEYARSSDRDVYDRTSKIGFFRLALVRTLFSGECMIMLQVNPSNLTPEETQAERENFTKFIVEKCKTADINLTSLYWQESSDMFNGIKEDMPITLLHGREYVVEKSLGLSFRISPFSFFQINPWATEIMYAKIRDICLAAIPKDFDNSNSEVDAEVDAEGKVVQKPKPGVILLDLCCGTGTIGQSLAKHVKKVIGIELCQSAITDAIQNANDNGLTNIEYICGKVEEKIHGVLNYGNIDKDDIVIAILDPPRAGVHHSVIKTIRETQAIKKLVFVACDFGQSIGNVVGLLRPTSGKFKGLPFFPTAAGAVDMFPHTKNLEVLIEFCRVDLGMLRTDLNQLEIVEAVEENVEVVGDDDADGGVDDSVADADGTTGTTNKAVDAEAVEQEIPTTVEI